MKRNKFFIFFLIFFILVSPLSGYAQTIKLHKLLKELTGRRLTTLQKINSIEKYKGLAVKGNGKVKDIIKSFTFKNEARVSLQKYYRGKPYEIILTVSQESAEKLKKGKPVRFEGTFAGMTLETFLFENATLY